MRSKSWKRITENLTLKGNGYATYTLQIDLPKDRPHLGLMIRYIYRAASIFVNGEPVAEIGKVATNKEDEENRELNKVILLPRDADQNNIVIHV